MPLCFRDIPHFNVDCLLFQGTVTCNNMMDVSHFGRLFIAPNAGKQTLSFCSAPYLGKFDLATLPCHDISMVDKWQRRVLEWVQPISACQQSLPHLKTSHQLISLLPRWTANWGSPCQTDKSLERNRESRKWIRTNGMQRGNVRNDLPHWSCSFMVKAYACTCHMSHQGA